MRTFWLPQRVTDTHFTVFSKTHLHQWLEPFKESKGIVLELQTVESHVMACTVWWGTALFCPALLGLIFCLFNSYILLISLRFLPFGGSFHNSIVQFDSSLFQYHEKSDHTALVSKTWKIYNFCSFRLYFWSRLFHKKKILNFYSINGTKYLWLNLP